MISVLGVYLPTEYFFSGTRAGRTEVVVTCMAKGVEPAEPLEADKQPIQKSPDIQTPDPSKVITVNQCFFFYF
jgi:hypothetical protein